MSSKSKESAYGSTLRQTIEEEQSKRYPDGPFYNQPKLTWYRVISDNGAIRWCFSGNREQQEFYAEVEDTGINFRWSVGFDGPVDEGYTRTLSLAKVKAEKLWHELTDSVEKDRIKEQDKHRGVPS